MVSDGVVHLAQFRPWHWSAPLHVEELQDEIPDVSSWYLRDQYITRMQEHKVYTEQLMDFYEDITMFPNVQLTETVNPVAVLEACRLALEESGS